MTTARGIFEMMNNGIADEQPGPGMKDFPGTSRRSPALISDLLTIRQAAWMWQLFRAVDRGLGDADRRTATT